MHIECGMKYCAASESICKFLTNLKQFSKTLSLSKHLKEKYDFHQSLIDGIQNCEEKSFLSSKDVCSNGKKCHHKSTVPLK